MTIWEFRRDNQGSPHPPIPVQIRANVRLEALDHVPQQRRQPLYFALEVIDPCLQGRRPFAVLRDLTLLEEVPERVYLSLVAGDPSKLTPHRASGSRAGSQLHPTEPLAHHRERVADTMVRVQRKRGVVIPQNA